MLEKLDDFLVDRVYQRLVIFLGWETKILVRACIYALIGIYLYYVADWWIRNGLVAFMSIILMFWVSKYTINPPKTFRSNRFDFTIRMILITLVLARLFVLSMFLLYGPLNYFIFLVSIGLVDSLLWLSIFYISVCRDPPPKKQFAFNVSYQNI